MLADLDICMIDGRYQPAGPVFEARYPRTNALTQLRRGYFSRCAATAARYHVSFEDIVRHLWRARAIQTRINLRRVGYLEDLVHAIGCLQHISTAWGDLSEQNERMLVRQCQSHLEDSESIVISPQGEIMAEASHDPQVLQAELNPIAIHGWREEFPALRDLRRDLLGEITMDHII